MQNNDNNDKHKDNLSYPFLGQKGRNTFLPKCKPRIFYSLMASGQGRDSMQGLPHSDEKLYQLALSSGRGKP